MSFAARAAVLGVVLAVVSGGAAMAGVSGSIQALLASDNPLTLEGQPLDAVALRRLYEPGQGAPLWTAPDSPLDAAALIESLGKAADQGLDPATYHVDALEADRTSSDEAAAARYELLLSDAFLRYATDMRMGRVRLSAIESDWALQPTPYDAVAALLKVHSREDFRTMLAGLAPTQSDYPALVGALKEWREKAAEAPWPSVLPGPALKQGMTDERVIAVRRRLIADGDLAADQDSQPAFDDAVFKAVKTFQERYGLEADGVIGQRTVAVMNISKATRLEQILATLERLRSLPRDMPATGIYVNAAAAQAVMLENGVPEFTARVIVGTPANPTPVVAARFQSLQLNPPWTVPYSISTKEILPKLKRDPSYLASQNMIILNRDDDPQGLTIDWSQYSRNYFPFVLRQLPGPATALGYIVFEMPNRYDVYLHDTPERRLFALGDRYFSHGCVRIENPRALASYLLRGNTQWSATALDEAIATGVTQRIALSQSVPVYLLYQTVYLSQDGKVQFRADIYGRDARLNVALARLKAGTLPANARIPVAQEHAAEGTRSGHAPGLAASGIITNVGR